VLKLPDEWAPLLNGQPETGMGYQVATVLLRDGSRYSEVVIVGGYIVSTAGSPEIPFSADQIGSIEVTQC
jgi:hypothetical protein